MPKGERLPFSRCSITNKGTITGGCQCNGCTQRRNYEQKRGLTYQRENKDRINKNHRERYARLKRVVMEHYAGNPPKCQCCGYPIYDFLTIDQIGVKGGWKEHRKYAGVNFYMNIIKRGFPDNYRVLCFNCNCSIGFYGYCPHQRVDMN